MFLKRESVPPPHLALWGREITLPRPHPHLPQCSINSLSESWTVNAVKTWFTLCVPQILQLRVTLRMRRTQGENWNARHRIVWNSSWLYEFL
jgi:aspartate aminotransferase-like enzyme